MRKGLMLLVASEASALLRSDLSIRCFMAYKVSVIRRDGVGRTSKWSE
jgi:hypothetical protein